MIAAFSGRNPEELTVQHDVFLKFLSLWFHFLIGILADEPDRIGEVCIPI
jgi:hypothetical protein